MIQALKKNAVWLIVVFMTILGSEMTMAALYLQDTGVQGVVSMEAENYHASQVAPDGHEWLSAGVSFPGFSGTDALQSLPDDNVGYTESEVSQSPRLDYQVDFAVTGTHYVWARAWGPSGTADSLHVSVDGAIPTTSGNIRVSPQGTYTWVGTVVGGTRATINISTVGEHTVNVWMRESGTVVDKVVLTIDPAYDPSTVNGGLGPDESGQGNPSNPAVETPVISPPGGTYGASVLVTLSTGTVGAKIHYTTDGSAPTTASTEYTSPFSLVSDATLQVQAYLTGYNDSLISTAVFQMRQSPSGLIRYLPFDESSGSSFTDTVAGVLAICSSCPAPAPGRIKTAQQYDGITNEVNLPDDGVFDWATGDRFSVEVWVNKNSACAGSNSIIGRDDANTQLHWWLGCENGNAAFALFDTAGAGAKIVGTTSITDGKWHHLVAIRDSITGENRLYVDGVEEALMSVNYSTGFDGVTELNIGWLNNSVMGYHFAGTIDEVALYNRVLSPAAISRHYLDGTIGLRRGYWGCDAPVKIMPLGDSITNRIISNPERVSYRPQLYSDLTTAGYDVDFIGSQTDSITENYDRDHEGHSGFDPSDISIALNNWLNLNPPEVILLHIGSNEDAFDPYPSSVPLQDMHNIIKAFDPNISVVQARIVNKVPYQSLVTQFNDNVQVMVEARVANGDKAIMVDHESALNYIDDLNTDGLHPNAVGSAKMAQVWFDGLATFMPACIPTAPQIISPANTAAEVGAPYVYSLMTNGFPAPDFSLLSAPAGMSIHPDTGEINWVPDTTGSFNVSVLVQNSDGPTTYDFTINVDLAPPSIADGDINGDGMVNAADVLLAVRIVLGLYTPTATEFQHGDVAPLVSGVPSPDNMINAGDLLLIQRKALGIVNF